MPLAADRVYLAEDVTTPTGGLLHHPFTLTGLSPAVYSLLHLPSDYSGHRLDGVLPHMQPGLSSRDFRSPATTCCTFYVIISKFSNLYPFLLLQPSKDRPGYRDICYPYGQIAIFPSKLRHMLKIHSIHTNYKG